MLLDVYPRLQIIEYLWRTLFLDYPLMTHVSRLDPQKSTGVQSYDSP